MVTCCSCDLCTAVTLGRSPGCMHSALKARPAVIGHRGASAYRPEHTLEAYRLAIALGADYVETDLVPTKDGVLVARHEGELSATTDVADRRVFRRRLTSKVIAGRPTRGWFAEDFTLDEIKALRARSRQPRQRPVSSRFDDRFEVATWGEVLDLTTAASQSAGRSIGVVAEMKVPTHFSHSGLSVAAGLLADLDRRGLNARTSPVVVQSFDAQWLRQMRQPVKTRLFQLASTMAGVRDIVDIASYADGVGLKRNLVQGTDLCARAHGAGLTVSAWTFRDDLRHCGAAQVAPRRSGRRRVGMRPPAMVALGPAVAAYWACLAQGVDAVITDNPDTAVAARRAWAESRDRAPRRAAGRLMF